MGWIVGDRVLRPLSMIREERDQDRVIGIIYRMFVMNEMPDLSGESDTVRLAVGCCVEEMTKAARRSEINAKYWATKHRIQYDGQSCKISEKSCKTERGKETEEREGSPHTPYKEKEGKEKEKPTPNPPSSSCKAGMFDRFWAAYPRKVAKADAKKAFDAVMNSTADRNAETLVRTMLDSLYRFRSSYDWVKDNGKFIPYPATWIRQRRWEDEFPANDEGATNAKDELAKKLAKGLKI